MEKLGGTLT